MQRRSLLTAGLLAPFVISGVARADVRKAAETLAPTPACDANQTPEQTAGPFYTPESPRRSSLREPGVTGEPLVVDGTVRDTACRPLAGALLDVWHADAEGRYDTRGYRLRGHLLTDEEGRYRLETIRPGAYPGRTPHIHVKLRAAGRPLLVTQLYFPDEPRNARDFLFRPDLLMTLERGGPPLRARFDFVLRS